MHGDGALVSTHPPHAPLAPKSRSNAGHSFGASSSQRRESAIVHLHGRAESDRTQSHQKNHTLPFIRLAARASMLPAPWSTMS
jgi:hypothetical protein